MVIASLLGILALDFGGLARQVACVIALYLTMAVIVIARRRFTPNASDIFVIKYGFGIAILVVLSVDIIVPSFSEWFQRSRH